MKKIAVTVSFLVAGTVGTLAADLPARTYTKAPAMAVDPAPNWTGFYVGVDVGGGWDKTGVTTLNNSTNQGVLGDLQSFSLNGSGILGGVHAGYNWQSASPWVFGIEGDFDWSGIRANISAPLTNGGVPTGGSDVLSHNVAWLASIRGRLGYSTGNWLLYATGGAAWGRIQEAASQPAFVGPVGTNATFSTASTSNGWVVGAGAEYALSRNWSVRGEYLFYSLNSAVSGTAFVQGFGVVPVKGSFFADTFGRTDIQTARIGLSYKFGNP